MILVMYILHDMIVWGLAKGFHSYAPFSFISIYPYFLIHYLKQLWVSCDRKTGMYWLNILHVYSLIKTHGIQSTHYLICVCNCLHLLPFSHTLIKLKIERGIKANGSFNKNACLMNSLETHPCALVDSMHIYQLHILDHYWIVIL